MPAVYAHVLPIIHRTAALPLPIFPLLFRDNVTVCRLLVYPIAEIHPLVIFVMMISPQFSPTQVCHH